MRLDSFLLTPEGLKMTTRSSSEHTNTNQRLDLSNNNVNNIVTSMKNGDFDEIENTEVRKRPKSAPAVRRDNPIKSSSQKVKTTEEHSPEICTTTTAATAEAGVITPKTSLISRGSPETMKMKIATRLRNEKEHSVPSVMSPSHHTDIDKKEKREKEKEKSKEEKGKGNELNENSKKSTSHRTTKEVIKDNKHDENRSGIVENNIPMIEKNVPMISPEILKSFGTIQMEAELLNSKLQFIPTKENLFALAMTHDVVKSHVKEIRKEQRSPIKSNKNISDLNKLLINKLEEGPETEIGDITEIDLNTEIDSDPEFEFEKKNSGKKKLKNPYRSLWDDEIGTSKSSSADHFSDENKREGEIYFHIINVLMFLFIYLSILFYIILFYSDPTIFDLIYFDIIWFDYYSLIYLIYFCSISSI